MFGPYLSKPSAGEIFFALLLVTFITTVIAGKAGLIAGPVLVALYYTYTWPREKPKV